MTLKDIKFKIIGHLMRLRWRIVKPFSIGVRAIIINDKNQVLLVKHTYANSWFLPGGGVDKKEHLLDALAREMKEELGLEIRGDVALLGTYGNFFEHKSDYTSVFVVKAFEIAPNKNAEIEKWAFFDFDGIPEATSMGTKKRLKEYRGEKNIDFRW